MNYKRILLGGLVTGLILNIGETILNIPVIGKDFDAAMQKLGLPTMESTTIGLFIVMLFLLGIVAIWLYAAVRNTLGPGPKTALAVGIVVWLLAFVFPNISTVAMRIFPGRLVLIALVWEAIEVPLAVLAGAALYRDEAAPVTARTASPAL